MKTLQPCFHRDRVPVSCISPMIVLAVASFNAGTDIAVWKGFTFAQYGALFRDGVLLPLLANSVIVAVIASLVATVLGTMAAIGIRAMSGRMRRITMAVTNIPSHEPGDRHGRLARAALRVRRADDEAQQRSRLYDAAHRAHHVQFAVCHSVRNAEARTARPEPASTPRSISAARPLQAFFKVIIHEIMPGILSGALMAFTMSLDDFVISLFCLRPKLCHAAGRDLQLYEKAASAEDLRAVHAALPCNPPCDGRDESRAGRAMSAAAVRRAVCSGRRGRAHEKACVLSLCSRCSYARC